MSEQGLEAGEAIFGGHLVARRQFVRIGRSAAASAVGMLLQIGERLLSAHENENPLFGLDSIPFIASSYDKSEKLWQAGKPGSYIQCVLTYGSGVSATHGTMRALSMNSALTRVTQPSQSAGGMVDDGWRWK